MLLIYTFRTFPWTKDLNSVFMSTLPTPGGCRHEVFIFGSLKKSLTQFCKLVEEIRPDLILGIAQSRNSRIESITVNRFNEGIIKKGGEPSYNLYVEENIAALLPVSASPTASFCNWTMYQISSFLKENNLFTKLSFVHINEEGLRKLCALHSS